MIRQPYTSCQSCSFEKPINTYSDVTMVPAGEVFTKTEFDIHPQLRLPEFPIYSDFKFQYCSDCSNFTLWFMAFNDFKSDIVKFNIEEKEMSNQYFINNPNIKPRCIECGSTNRNLKPIHKCGGSLILQWRNTGIISEQIIFREWWYYPDGRIYKTNIERY